MKNQEDYWNSAQGTTYIGIDTSASKSVSTTVNVCQGQTGMSYTNTNNGNVIAAGGVGTYITASPYGGWTVGTATPEVWGGTNQYYDNSIWLEKLVDKKYVANLIAEKNYSSLCNIADIVAKKDRKSFGALERVILSTGDFETIGLYLRSVKNVSVNHLTTKFLNAYVKSDRENKAERFMTLAYEARHRLDLRTCFRFAMKKKDAVFVQWILSNPYHRDLDSNFIDAKISAKMLHKFIEINESPTALFSLAYLSSIPSKEKIYRRIRKLGNFELAKKMIEGSTEDWAIKLSHMK